MAIYRNPKSSVYARGSEFQRSAAFDDPAYRARLLAHAAREALLDIVWSNVEIPRNMKAVVQPGQVQSSFSKTRDAEVVRLGADMIPRSAAQDMPPDAARAEYGLCDGFVSDKEFEQYGRQHLLRQYGHYLYSDDELPKLAARARAVGADEQVFGLLETIRVERRMGLAMGEQSDWRDFYPRSESEQMDPPLRPLFHWLREGWRTDSGLGPEAESRFQNFYERLVMASDSSEVMELAKEWKDEIFPQAQQEQEQDQQQDQQQDQEQEQEADQEQEQEADQDSDQESQSSKDSNPSDSKHNRSSDPGRSGNGSPGGLGNAGTPSPSQTGQSEPKDASAEPSSEGTKKGPNADPKNKAKKTPADGSGVDKDPLGINKGPAKPADSPSGMPSMLEQIVNGFKEPPKPSPSGSKPGSGSGSDGEKGGEISVAAPTDAEAKSARSHAFSKGSSPSSSEPVAGEWNAEPANQEILEGSRDFYEMGLFSSASGRGGLARLNEEKIGAVTRVIQKMFTGKARSVASDTPSKKMSVRHMARNEVKYIRKEDYSRGKMFVDMVVDCSGSMSGEPIESARLLIAALSDLAVKNVVEGRVVFSSGEGWMACQLPMSRERIAGIDAFSGSEGIKKALYDNALKLRVADAVFVFTDAEITDQSFDKTQLAARKVEPLGLYVGGSEAENGMSRYFDRYIIRESLQELALGMVQRFMMQKKETVKTQEKKARLRGG